MISIRSTLAPLIKNAQTASILGSSDVIVRSLKTMSTARSFAVRSRMRAAMKRYKKPQLMQAMSMPMSPQEMDNSTLVILSALEHHPASEEMLKRHIMVKDKVQYDGACEKYQIIAAKNRENLYLLSLPYHLGIAVALSAGLVALPLVFHLPTAHWFNHHFVTCEVPEPHDLETLLEVGSWTWNWMYVPYCGY
jgi:hypothetical protein